MGQGNVYLPSDFWGVAFKVEGSALPKIIPRSIIFIIPALVATLVSRQGPFGIEDSDKDVQIGGFQYETPEVPSGLITPFALLVALLTSYRLNHAHGKWEIANDSVMTTLEQTRVLISRMCAIFPPNEANKERLLRFRRLIVLACVMIQKHVRLEKDMKAELERGIITAEEYAMFSRVSTISCTDHKVDKYPSKNRPALVFFWLHRELHLIFEAHDGAMTPVRAMLDGDLAKLSATFEMIELLNQTVLPIAYAQLTRLVCLAFLVLLPFAAHQTMGPLVIPLAFISNIIYFTVDLCASQMEAPFGDDDRDVDLQKKLRQMDKYTASLLAVYVGGPVENYDLFPEKRTTDQGGQKRRPHAVSTNNVYQLELRRRANRERRASAVAQCIGRRRSAAPSLDDASVRGSHSLASKLARGAPAPPAAPASQRTPSSSTAGSETSAGEGSATMNLGAGSRLRKFRLGMRREGGRQLTKKGRAPMPDEALAVPASAVPSKRVDVEV